VRLRTGPVNDPVRGHGARRSDAHNIFVDGTLTSPGSGAHGGAVGALRAILLNVLFRQSNGERLTADEMQRLVDRADSDKLRKARERLLQAQESEGQRKEKS
jgi:hypothetical protein